MTVKSKTMAMALGIGLVLFFSVSVSAQVPTVLQNSSRPVAINVATVNMQDAIMSTDEGKKEMNALEQRFVPKEQELKKANNEVEGLKKQLSTLDPKLTDDQRRNLAETLENKRKLFQRNLEDFQSEVQKSEQETVNKIGEKMMKIIEKYASAQGYVLVLDASNPQTGIVWINPSTNITKELIAAYNSQFPVSSTGSKPAPGRP